MKKRFLKTLVATVIAVTLALLSMPVSFAAEYSGTTKYGLTWAFNESTGTLTLSGKATATDDIWSDDMSPDKDSVKSLVIKDGVTGIEAKLFEYCDNIADITIPDSIQYIGEDAFEDTEFYKNSANWENGVLYIGKFLIEAKSELSGDYKIKDGTKVICELAFNCCLNLTNITIPESVTTIGEKAFQSCEALTSVTIPDSVKTIENRAFSYCKSLASISIGDGVTRIGYEVFDETVFFMDESNWENGVISNSVLYCGNYLIVANRVSGDYTIKDGTKVIAQGAFEDCEELTGVTIPDSVTSIGTNAFYDTGIYNDVSNWENNVLYIGDCLIIAYRIFESVYSKYDTSCLSGDYTIKEGTRVIADYAFTHCENLTSITIPESVKTIGAWAFWNCDSISKITLPSGVTKIEEGTFNDCDNLYSITIGNGVTSIDNKAFYFCHSLSEINYSGSESEWNKISIGAYNDYLMSATKHFAQNTNVDGEGNADSSANNSSKSDSEKKSGGSSKPAVIIIGSVVVIAAASGGVFIIRKKKKV